MFNVDRQNTPIKDRCQNEFKHINHSNYIRGITPMTKLKRRLCKMVDVRDIRPMQTKGKQKNKGDGIDTKEILY